MDPKIVLIGLVALLVIGVVLYSVLRPKKTGPAVKVVIATVNQQTNLAGRLALSLPAGWTGDTFGAVYYDADGLVTTPPVPGSPIWSCAPSSVAMVVPETEAHSVSVVPVSLGVALLAFSDGVLIAQSIPIGVANS